MTLFVSLRTPAPHTLSSRSPAPVFVHDSGSNITASADIGTLADMGILYNLSKPDLLDILTRSGLSHLTQKELAKIMEAAILISPVGIHLISSFREQRKRQDEEG